MKTIQKKQDDKKKTTDTAIARVTGAVQVANVAVSTTMAIIIEALDDVEALKIKSNGKTGDHAVKKIIKNTKKV